MSTKQARQKTAKNRAAANLSPKIAKVVYISLAENMQEVRYGVYGNDNLFHRYLMRKHRHSSWSAFGLPLNGNLPQFGKQLQDATYLIIDAREEFEELHVTVLRGILKAELYKKIPVTIKIAGKDTHGFPGSLIDNPETIIEILNK